MNFTEKQFPQRVVAELANARAIHPDLASAHEGYAVILEELDEFWEEVRKRKKERDKTRMYEELVQIAAMAQRTAEDVLSERTG